MNLAIKIILAALPVVIEVIDQNNKKQK